MLTPSLPQSKKTALITGVTGALGSVVARRFLAAGFQVIGTFHQRSASEPREENRLTWLEMDVTDPASVQAGAASLERQGIAVAMLVHCAGGFRFSPVDRMRDQDLDFLLDTNLKSAFYLLREWLPGMKRRNHGRIILVSSNATRSAPAGMAAYAASKAGLNLLTESVAQEVRAFDITINAVLPSIIDTPANRRDMPDSDFNTWVKAEDLAEIIFMLAQPWAKSIHGALIPVSGRV